MCVYWSIGLQYCGMFKLMFVFFKLGLILWGRNSSFLSAYVITLYSHNNFMFRFLKNMLFLPLRTNIILHVVPAQAFKWHLKLTFTHSDISAQVAWISVFASTLGFVHSMSRMCYHYDFSIVGGIHSWSGCKEWCQPEADLAKPSWQDLDHGGWRRSVSSLQVLVYTVNIKPF